MVFQVPDLVPIVLVEFDYLVIKDKIEEDENFKDFLNPVVRKDRSWPYIVKALARGELNPAHTGSVVPRASEGSGICARSILVYVVFGVPTLDTSMWYSLLQGTACHGGCNTRAQTTPAHPSRTITGRCILGILHHILLTTYCPYRTT